MEHNPCIVSSKALQIETSVAGNNNYHYENKIKQIGLQTVIRQPKVYFPNSQSRIQVTLALLGKIRIIPPPKKKKKKKTKTKKQQPKTQNLHSRSKRLVPVWPYNNEISNM